MQRCAVILLAALAAATPALADPRLLLAEPAPDSVVVVPPTEIRLGFDEPVAAENSSVTVTGGDGAVWSGTAEAVPEAGTLVVKLPALGPGHYAVHWRAAGEAASTEGDFGFDIAP